jgi:hypothetical protein
MVSPYHQRDAHPRINIFPQIHHAFRDLHRLEERLATLKCPVPGSDGEHHVELRTIREQFGDGVRQVLLGGL